nr:hypothetical protein CPGR_00008 [Mycolicibacter nonchromogenicus]
MSAAPTSVGLSGKFRYSQARDTPADWATSIMAVARIPLSANSVSVASRRRSMVDTATS